MNYIGKFISNFKEAYNEINAATLTGAIDVVVVRQSDNSFNSSPFHVRFGKIGVLRSREKVVDIEINGEAVDIHMKLGENGEAFFVEEIKDGEDWEEILGTSPLPCFLNLKSFEDELKSQDSGVGAEEVLCKSLKDKQRLGLKGDISSQTFSVSSSFKSQNPEGSVQYDVESHFPKISGAEGFQEDNQVRRGSLPDIDGCDRDNLTINIPLSNINPEFPLNPNIESWRDSSNRSKSLTNELVFQKDDCVTPEGLPGCRTDIEDASKVSKVAKRRRRKRFNRRDTKTSQSESNSSDNSTPNDLADLSSLRVSEPQQEERVTGVAEAQSSSVNEIGDPMFVMDGFDQQRPTRSHSRVKSLDMGKKRGSKCDGLARSDRMSISVFPEFHPFSDTDISPPPSPGKARSASPIKSDTEYECEKQRNVISSSTADAKTAKWSWTWGELPTPPTAQRSNTSSRQSFAKPNEVMGGEPTTSTHDEDEERSMLGNMFSFMRATKKARHNPQSEGIYLDDLNIEELDPEVAALYFARNSSLLGKQNCMGFKTVPKDDDVESGNGTSLPHSPHSVEGAIGDAKMACVDSDTEYSATRHPIFDYKGYHDVAFSLCGRLHEHLEDPIPESLFLQTLVTYDDFCENPSIIEHPDLVVRINGAYYNWASAASQIMSLVLYQMPLPKKVTDVIVNENMPKKEIRKRTESKGYSWFLWGRNQEAQSAENPNNNPNQELSPSSSKNQETSQPLMKPDGTVSYPTSNINESPVQQPDVAPSEEGDGQGSPATVQDQTISFERNDDSSESDEMEESLGKRYKKTIRLSSEQIAKLNLKNGINEVVFSVTTAYQGTTRCKCHIFLWNYDEKIVISDIDGTITKSDVLGHILPIIGKDWAQGGVAQLFSKIKNNGYNFLYLSARAIGQARITREYLRSVRQGDISLPDGPLLLNPTSLIQAFHREVIERKPEEFKISCLRDIKALFPENENPFYAGYGNRINDVWAYSAVGVPIQRIFTINHRGELKHELTQTFQTTIVGQVKVVDETFPPIRAKMLSFGLYSYMYSDDEEDEEWEGAIDLDYDSDWEGVPSMADIINMGV